MSVYSTFFRHDNEEDSLQSIIAVILDTLKKRSTESSEASMSESTKPWALVITKDVESINSALAKRFYQKPDDRMWFDSIQICRIDAANQLKTKLCSLHVSVQEQKNDILDIIEYEKQGQSPSMVVVIDVIEYLAHDPSLNEMQYLTISFNELSNLLACLLESSIYLSTRNVGVNMNHFVELLLTDSLPSNVNDVMNEFQRSYTAKLYQILHYYLDHVYHTPNTI
ncbi:heme peroxidase [Mucor velutinosus]|uniref:Heme peroxidase n=1 Tax=Mucor velutinosus TaxID=708070 RepID=A0AAN7DQK1_9FUNG|nr:heme peroxidase [Mucor velutinosus]